jgi:hypothetical protein
VAARTAGVSYRRMQCGAAVYKVTINMLWPLSVMKYLAKCNLQWRNLKAGYRLMNVVASYVRRISLRTAYVSSARRVAHGGARGIGVGGSSSRHRRLVFSAAALADCALCVTGGSRLGAAHSWRNLEPIVWPIGGDSSQPLYVAGLL